MAENQTYDVTVEECGKTIQVTVKDCTACSVNVHPCCCCCCSGSGGGDDTAPGEMILTLAGSAGQSSFYDVIETDDGHMVYGYSDDAPGGTVLVSFDHKLSMTGQVSYEGDPATLPNAFFLKQRDGDGYVLPLMLHNGGYSHSFGAVLVDKGGAIEKRIALQDPARGIFGFGRGTILPPSFSDSACYAFVSYVHSEPQIITLDKDLNLLACATLPRVGTTLQPEYLQVIGDKLFAAGQIYSGGKASAIIYRLSNTLEREAVMTFSHDTDMHLVFMRETEYGYLLAGESQELQNGKYNILLVGVDHDFTVVKRTIVGTYSGDDVAWTMDTNSQGDVLLCGSTNGAGAGDMDCFLLRLDKDLRITEELTLGTAGVEYRDCSAIFNKDGSVTAVGSVGTNDGGGSDAFIATFRGNWKDLTGSVGKYPALRISGKPGFMVKESNFELQFDGDAPFDVYPSSPVTEQDFTVVSDMGRTLIENPERL